jgi:endonuclease YncB( thermonuclease family)
VNRIAILAFLGPLLFAMGLLVVKHLPRQPSSAADRATRVEAPLADTRGQHLKGMARVIDGDTVEVEGRRVRLHAVDAPEAGQTCLRDGRLYACGQLATRYLAGLIGTAELSCTVRHRDRYGRAVATGSVADGRDLGAELVSNGWALAYRRYGKEYVGMEIEAAEARKGIWSGQFIEPSRWRAGDRL